MMVMTEEEKKAVALEAVAYKIFAHGFCPPSIFMHKKTADIHRVLQAALSAANSYVLSFDILADKLEFSSERSDCPVDISRKIRNRNACNGA